MNGSPITGLVFNSAGLLSKYVLAQAASVAITLATQTVTGAYSSGGFVEVDATAFPGIYRFDIPNAALASGDHVIVSLYGFSGMSVTLLEYDLWAVNPQDATAFGVSRIDAAISSRMATFSLPSNFSLFSIDGNGRVDVIKLAGTSQTARDIGASVLLSSGTGTGQLDFTSGVVKANLAQILGTALTETAGLLAGGFKKFFNVSAPTLTCLGVDQTGDSYIRIGAPAGASVSADVAAVKVDTAAVKVQTDKLVFSVANQVDVNVLDWKGSTAPAMTGDAFARLGVPAGASISADIAEIELETDDIAAVKLKTDNLPASPAAVGSAMTLTGDFTATMKTSLNAATPAVTVSDKTGFSLSVAGIQAIWDALTSALTTVGSIGKLLVTNIDAAISSRSTYGGVDTSGTTTLLSRLTGTRATNLDNLDAAVSSRSTYAGGAVASVTAGVTVSTNNDKTGYGLSAAYDLAKTAAQAGDAMTLTSGERVSIATAVWVSATRTLSSFGTLVSDIWAAVADSTGVTTLLSRLTNTRATNLDHLDADISSRLATAGYTAPDNTDIIAIKAKTDNLPASPAAVGSAMTLSAAYDAAKTSAQAGDPMTLTGGERDSIANTLLDIANGVETGYTLRDTQRLQLAALAGKLHGALTTTVVLRDVNDTKDRVIATVDTNGNRTAVTLDAS